MRGTLALMLTLAVSAAALAAQTRAGKPHCLCRPPASRCSSIPSTAAPAIPGASWRCPWPTLHQILPHRNALLTATAFEA